MSAFTLNFVDKKSIIPGLNIFTKAMGFDETIKEQILTMVNHFYDHQSFIGITASENSSNTVVGFGSLIPLLDTAWIPFVGVDPEHQKKGLGRIIMEKLLAISKEHNWNSVELCASQAGYPLYKKLGFSHDYTTTIVSITGMTGQPSEKLEITHDIPNWLYTYDREILGTDRKNIFAINYSDQLTVIAEPNNGYGILDRKRIGPVLADSYALAKDIYLTARNLGAETAIIAEENAQKSKFYSFIDKETIIATTKMTYGTPLKQEVSKIFGLRSLAFG